MKHGLASWDTEVYVVGCARKDGTAPSAIKIIGHIEAGSGEIWFTEEEAKEVAVDMNQSLGPYFSVFRATIQMWREPPIHHLPGVKE